ncbi:hypothetical protein [Nocardia cyriacigeorgica]|uniref:hypothetical protein n=1 Tax=Nocardia cyriacigeorgica TaxID=135487 RepID=UPI0024546E93|nr:hypothetical protein [Nocardia cyriacigeorgica]
MPELTDDDLHDIADPWHAIAEVGGSMRALAAALAAELLAARAEIAALRNDLSAKISDFDAAVRHLGEVETCIAELGAELVGARTRITDLEERGAKQRARIAELEDERDRLRAEPAQGRINAEDDAATINRFAARIAELETAQRPRFSQRHLEQVTRQRDEARARIAELEQQALDAMPAAVDHDQAGEIDILRARVAELSDCLDAQVLQRRSVQRIAQRLWRSRRRWQDRAAALEAERDAAQQVIHDHRCGDQAERAYRRAATAEARVAELEAQQGEPIGYMVAHTSHDGATSFGRPHYGHRANAEAHVARLGSAWRVVELREASNRG